MFCSSKERMKFRCVRIKLLFFSFTFFIMFPTRCEQQAHTCLPYGIPVPTRTAICGCWGTTTTWRAGRSWPYGGNNQFLCIWSCWLGQSTGPPLSVLLMLPITCILFQYIMPLKFLFGNTASQIHINGRQFFKLNSECIYFDYWVGE